MRIIDHPSVKTPHGNKTIWRYMVLPKFLDLLHRERLFFRNATRLTDKFEGTVPARTEAAIEKMTSDVRDPEYESGWADYLAELEAARSQTLVSCWSLDTGESYALWKIYLDGSSYGVAIRTTVGRFQKALELGADAAEIVIGQVHYDDRIDPRDLTPIRVACTKRPFYKYEKEVRAVIQALPPSGPRSTACIEPDRYVAVDVERLIKSVHVSPFAGRWFFETVREVTSKLRPRIALRLKQSGIVVQ